MSVEISQIDIEPQRVAEMLQWYTGATGQGDIKICRYLQGVGLPCLYIIIVWAGGKEQSVVDHFLPPHTRDIDNALVLHVFSY